jgi:UDP-N-acetyl-D-mannosaminuronic acid dehydrogenase
MRDEIASPQPGSTIIGVIGLGYVGLPVACEFARAGFRVIGLDIKADRVAKIEAGINPIEGNEPGLSELLREVIGSGRLQATCDYQTLAMADVITINVETPVDEQHVPQYHALRAACRSLGKVLKPGALVIVESTVAPGTTSNIVRPILEESSGYQFERTQAHALSPNSSTFYLGACPERVMPGKLLANLRSLSRVCGGSSPAIAQAMTKLYRYIVPEADLDPTDILTAELVKTTENAYRDVQIAFANEVALVCEAVGGDVWRVRELVNKSPGRNMLLPGAGVGGHCIPKDPWLLTAPVRNAALNADAQNLPAIRLIPAARAVNESMPEHVAAITLAAIAAHSHKLPNQPYTPVRVAILGYSYLEESDDTRDTPSAKLATLLRNQGVDLIIHDPFVEEFKGDLYQRLAGCDAVVLMVKHSEYCKLHLPQLASELRTPILIDGRGFFEPETVAQAGLVYKGVGR